MGVVLKCSIGPTYPEDPPEITIQIKEGLSDGQAQDLTDLAKQVACDNVGMVMGYTMAEAIREWLAENNVSSTDGSMHANMLRRMDEKSKQTRKETARIEVRVKRDSFPHADLCVSIGCLLCAWKLNSSQANSRLM